LVVIYTASKILKKVLRKFASAKEVKAKRIFYIEKVFDSFFILLVFLLLSFVWRFDISVLATSIFAVVGVALFAQWSILSNITASIIIFFTFPARVGDTIRVIDGDNSVEGKITEITLFQISLIDKENNTILYPNNLLLQKPVKKIV
jgi:small-conductance mechanosensitive channel